MPDVTAVTEVARPARVVYDHCSDISRLAASMRDTRSVTRTGTGRFRWRLGGARDWEVEVVENIVNERLVLAPVDGVPGPVLALTVDDVGPSRSRLTLALTGLPSADVEALQAVLDEDVTRLRRDIEAGSPPAPDDPGPG